MVSHELKQVEQVNEWLLARTRAEMIALGTVAALTVAALNLLLTLLASIGSE